MAIVHQYTVTLTKAEYDLLDFLNERLLLAMSRHESKEEADVRALMRCLVRRYCKAQGFKLLKAHGWYYMERDKQRYTLDVNIIQ